MNQAGENRQLDSSKLLALRRNGKNSSLPLREKPIHVKDLRDAKKLLSRLLVALQRGEVEGREAKDMAYLLSVFIQVVRDVEFEERLNQIETKLANQNHTQG